VGVFILGGFRAAGRSLFFARPKKRDEKKGRPMVWPCGLPCASRPFGRTGNSPLKSTRAQTLPRLFPKRPAMLGCTNGDPGVAPHTPTLVIPAKAGIQALNKKPALAGQFTCFTARLGSLCQNYKRTLDSSSFALWVFAGMTALNFGMAPWVPLDGAEHRSRAGEKRARV